MNERQLKALARRLANQEGEIAMLSTLVADLLIKSIPNFSDTLRSDPLGRLVYDQDALRRAILDVEKALHDLSIEPSDDSADPQYKRWFLNGQTTVKNLIVSTLKNKLAS